MLNGSHWKQTYIILSFLILHISTIFGTLLLTMRATFSKGFLLTVVAVIIPL